VRGCAIRVGCRDDPQVDAVYAFAVNDRVGDRDAGGFVAVDVAQDAFTAADGSPMRYA
jgi:hypothetical protein